LPDRKAYRHGIFKMLGSLRSALRIDGARILY